MYWKFGGSCKTMHYHVLNMLIVIHFKHLTEVFVAHCVSCCTAPCYIQNLEINGTTEFERSHQFECACSKFHMGSHSWFARSPKYEVGVEARYTHDSALSMLTDYKEVTCLYKGHTHSLVNKIYCHCKGGERRERKKEEFNAAFYSN